MNLLRQPCLPANDVRERPLLHDGDAQQLGLAESRIGAR